jgi:hypothetical protein
MGGVGRHAEQYGIALRPLADVRLDPIGAVPLRSLGAVEAVREPIVGAVVEHGDGREPHAHRNRPISPALFNFGERCRPLANAIKP